MARPDGENRIRARSRGCWPLWEAPTNLSRLSRPGDWNQFEVIADGNTLIHIVNGHVMAILVDNDPTFSQSKGLIGLRLKAEAW